MPSGVGSQEGSIRVFVSSTMLDDGERRRTVEDALLRAGMVPVGFERLTASTKAAVEERIEQVRGCHWLIGIVAHRYGQIPGGHECSMMEIEYDTAKAAGMPCLMFVLDESVDVNPQRDFDEGADRWDKQKKLDAFKAKVGDEQSPARFRGEDLGALVLQAAFEERGRQDRVRAERSRRERSLESADQAKSESRRPVVVLAFANDRRVDGKTLRNLPNERRAIEQRLEEHAELRILHDARLEDVWDVFGKAPVQDRAQVFHFAGHASGSWLAFEDDTGSPVEAGAEGIAGFLGRQEGLVLVFLNGCSTRAQIRRLRARVPVVIATTEAIRDDTAADLAGRFYAELRTKPLERAFADAVDYLKAKYGGTPRGVMRELVVGSDFDASEWPWVLDCDDALKTWRLGSAPPPRKASGVALASTEELISEAELKRYLAKAESLHHKMNLVGFESSVRVKIKLDDLHVPLDAMLDRGRRGRDVFGNAQHAEEAKELYGEIGRCEVKLAEAFDRAREMERRGVLVLGDPGSGKTTHLKQVLLKVIKDGPESIGLPEGTVPVFLPLRKLGDRSRGLPGIIQEQLKSPQLDLAEDFGERLCRRGKILYLLDGLDEVADATERAEVARWIEEALEHGPESYFLVSCRYAGYTKDVELDAEFLELHLRPLSDAQMKAFVTNWYAIVEKESLDDPQQAAVEAAERTKDLLGTLTQTEFTAVARVYAMTRNPLLLTAICLVHRDRGRLPTARAQLYEDSIGVLLERWRKRLPEALHPSEAIEVLQPVARWMHEKSGRTVATAEQLVEPVNEGLSTLRHVEMSAESFLRRIRDESGLLTGWGVDEYGFMHLGFQEYLAAQRLRNEGLAKPGVLWALARRFGDSWWQEVILLMLAQRNPSVFEQFMRALVRQPEFAGWHESELMRLCMNEAAVPSAAPFVELLGLVAGDGDDKDLGRRQLAATQVLAQAIPSALEGLEKVLQRHSSNEVRRWWRARQRERERGDEVTVIAPRGGVELVLIPAGAFLMGEGDQAHEVELSSFYIARTPVTNGQYEEYLVESPGVDKPAYWGHRQFNRPEQPVVGVSWVEARSYCAWAGLKLPTEAQWEYACRAGATTNYHSGNSEIDLARVAWFRGNSNNELQSVSQKEPNDFGLYDMHGNVWEWCEDANGPYTTSPRASDGLRHEPVGAVKRVLRGGGFNLDADFARSAFRFAGWPGLRNFGLGFRPVVGTFPKVG